MLGIEIISNNKQNYYNLKTTREKFSTNLIGFCDNNQCYNSPGGFIFAGANTC